MSSSEPVAGYLPLLSGVSAQSHHRSVLWKAEASKSRRVVSGDDHSPMSVRCTGKRRSHTASGAIVALMLRGQLQARLLPQVPVNLCRGDACHVTRTCSSNHTPSSDSAGLLVSGT